MSPVIVNKNTGQTPITLGRTVPQSIKFIPASRFYVKAVDSQTAAPVHMYYTKSNGTTPTGWDDLGVMLGAGAITYEKTRRDITTGIDRFLRLSYVESKTAGMEVTLGQFDDFVLERVTGLTPSVIINASILNFQIGQETIVQKAVLLVYQNKLDGKEFQWYNPNAFLDFTFVEAEDGMAVRVNCFLPFFTASGQTIESVLSCTEFA